jgi:hypothetical protein
MLLNKIFFKQLQKWEHSTYLPILIVNFFMESSCISVFYHQDIFLVTFVKTKFASRLKILIISGLGYFLNKHQNRCTLLAGDIEPQRGLNDL